jgi:hypothetical protein
MCRNSGGEELAAAVGEGQVHPADQTSQESAGAAAGAAAGAEAAVGAEAAILDTASLSTAAAEVQSELGGILEAKVNQARCNRQSLSHMSLDQVDRESIERFLSSLRHCKARSIKY